MVEVRDRRPVFGETYLEVWLNCFLDRGTVQSPCDTRAPTYCNGYAGSKSQACYSETRCWPFWGIIQSGRPHRPPQTKTAITNPLPQVSTSAALESMMVVCVSLCMRCQPSGFPSLTKTSWPYSSITQSKGLLASLLSPGGSGRSDPLALNSDFSS
jgi:hypothetical protein